MDFQEAFLVLFWPVWSRLLGLFVAVTVATAVYWIFTKSATYRTPTQGNVRFAGLSGND